MWQDILNRLCQAIADAAIKVVVARLRAERDRNVAKLLSELQEEIGADWADALKKGWDGVAAQAIAEIRESRPDLAPIAPIVIEILIQALKDNPRIAAALDEGLEAELGHIYDYVVTKIEKLV